MAPPPAHLPTQLGQNVPPRAGAGDLISLGGQGHWREALGSCCSGWLVGARPEVSLQEIRKVKTVRRSEEKKCREPPWKSPRPFSKTRLSMIYHFVFYQRLCAERLYLYKKLCLLICPSTKRSFITLAVLGKCKISKYADAFEHHAKHSALHALFNKPEISLMRLKEFFRSQCRLTSQ